MASIIFATAKAAYSTASYILISIGQYLPIDNAVEVTPKSSPNRSTKIFANAVKDDMPYIPWPLPSSRVRVMPDTLPRENFVVFHDDILYDVPLTFCDRKLPSPDEVRAASSLLPFNGQPHVVSFPSLGIVVKFGLRPCKIQSAASSDTSLSEAQSLHTVRRLLGDRVPVPRVYALIYDRDQIFLYMELVQGVTLDECWADLSDEARMDVCAQLKPMMQALRELEQDPSDPFIGTISRQPPQDILFEFVRIPEPFKSVAAFHNYFCNPNNHSSLRRQKLCDNQQIYFTHGDINRVSIIVSPPCDGPVCIRAIIDWHQSGWYPANWEYCKARLQTSDRELSGWQCYLSEFLERWPTP